MKTVRLFASWVSVFYFGILINQACAQLGGLALPSAPYSSTQSASASIPGVVRHAAFNGAAVVRNVIDDGGTSIAEYADSTGRIFAYTWHGPTMPDLRALLGDYLGAYRAGASEQASAAPLTASLHASRVQAGDVIVETGGRMRAYTGRAWLPAALPPGITPADLR